MRSIGCLAKANSSANPKSASRYQFYGGLFLWQDDEKLRPELNWRLSIGWSESVRIG